MSANLPTPLDDLIDPFTGEVVDPTNIDQVISALESANTGIRRAYAFKDALVRAIVQVAPPFTTTGTVRVRGDSRRVTLVRPPLKFEQRELKILAGEPYAAGVIVPAEYRVALAEYNKILNESGNKKFTAFRDALVKACRGHVGTPQVKIES